MSDNVQGLFSRRLKLLRERKKVTMVELADAIEMSQAIISEWEQGHKFPRSGALQELAKYFNVPMEYFFKKEVYPSIDLLTIRYFPSVLDGMHSIIHGLNDEIEVIKLPKVFLGKFLNDEKLIACKVESDSMDLIFPKDATIVMKRISENEVIDGDIVVYYNNDTFTPRRFRRNELEKVLVFSSESKNQNYHDFVIPFNSQHEIEIIAKVIWYGVLL